MLASVLYAIVSTTMIGLLMIAALVMGYDTAKPLIIVTIVSLILSVPFTKYVTGRLMLINNKRPGE